MAQAIRIFQFSETRKENNRVEISYHKILIHV